MPTDAEEQRIVAPEQASMRLYRFSQLNFSARLPSKRQCQLAIRAGEVRVNGYEAEETRRLKAGDVVTLHENARLRAQREFSRLGVQVCYEADYTAERVTDLDAKAAGAATMTPVVADKSRVEQAADQRRFLVAWKPAGIACQTLELADDQARALARQASMEAAGRVSAADASTLGMSTAGEVQTPSRAVYWLEKSACGWVLIARTDAAFDALKAQLREQTLTCLFRVMCKGKLGAVGAELQIPADTVSAHEVDSTTDDVDNDEMDETNRPAKVFNTNGPRVLAAMPLDCRVELHTASNHAGHLTTLDVRLNVHGRTRLTLPNASSRDSTGDGSSDIGTRPATESEIALRRDLLEQTGSLGRLIRRAFDAIDRPVIGLLPNSQSLPSGRGKGYMLSVTELKFEHPTTHAPLHFECGEPAKFDGVRQREARFNEQRRARDTEALEAAGLQRDVLDADGQSTPAAYLTGEKVCHVQSASASCANV
ncbi:hypothetical protein THASP1DRAFT_25722 [Thamnocephalis sphaerospora]|uniref:RNA-binding S4 domain-containing protein n=1 Tax=Thamnocephalis sphaerospora TaxID=78915 RepID=A0A4P9XJC5_9FUNG|nr:hypothetical protein THASP1DRAFT_25722 [Thamnocephalis sphaerospora]|eukprot:RKP05852.1 hypothetical protein THASP1DRAFT_25722 [Thamnocephalis sphaerospora]